MDLNVSTAVAGGALLAQLRSFKAIGSRQSLFGVGIKNYRARRRLPDTNAPRIKRSWLTHVLDCNHEGVAVLEVLVLGVGASGHATGSSPQRLGLTRHFQKVERRVTRRRMKVKVNAADHKVGRSTRRTTLELGVETKVGLGVGRDGANHAIVVLPLGVIDVDPTATGNKAVAITFLGRLLAVTLLSRGQLERRRLALAVELDVTATVRTVLAQSRTLEAIRRAVARGGLGVGVKDHIRGIARFPNTNAPRVLGTRLAKVLDSYQEGVARFEVGLLGTGSRGQSTSALPAGSDSIGDLKKVVA